MLDACVPQTADQLVDVLKMIDTSLRVVAEQVIQVPKIMFQKRIPPRTALRGSQTAEQLVEVPTVEFSVEQTADKTVQGGVSGALQGNFPGRSSTAVGRMYVSLVRPRILVIFKALSPDKVQQRSVELVLHALKIFLQNWVQQRIAEQISKFRFKTLPR